MKYHSSEAISGILLFFIIERAMHLVSDIVIRPQLGAPGVKEDRVLVAEIATLGGIMVAMQKWA